MPKIKSIGKVEENKLNKDSSMERQKLITGILIVAILVFAGAAWYFYSQLSQVKQNPQKVAQVETKELVAKAAKLIVLPEGEEPTVATVVDPEVLKDQPFFANAKKGDKVLIYPNSRKAILYDPVANKIVEVAPVNIGQPAQATPPASKTPPSGKQPQ